MVTEHISPNLWRATSTPNKSSKNNRGGTYSNPHLDPTTQPNQLKDTTSSMVHKVYNEGGKASTQMITMAAKNPAGQHNKGGKASTRLTQL